MSKNEILTKAIEEQLEKANYQDLEFVYYFLLNSERETAQEC